MEILSACQGIDLKKVNKNLGLGTEKACTAVREIVSYYDKDRVMNIDINAVETLIEKNSIVENVEKVIGELKI